MNWNDYFHYENGAIFWKTRAGVSKKWTSRFLNKQAGCVYKNGYIVVSVDDKLHYAHRIIWEMKNGKIENGMQIDHINHDRSDNRIENLRVVDNQVNHTNRPKQSNNSTGVVGVYKKSCGSRFYSQIKVNGSKIYLGTFSTIEEASSARKNAEIFYGFHENHGK